jgi:hypothetical protein
VPLFKFDEDSGEYVAEIAGINVTINSCTDDMVEYGKTVAEKYESCLPGIIEYILSDEAFGEDGEFDCVTEEQLKTSLNKPEIRLLAGNDRIPKTGVCTYCNQTLDDEHIFSFEFVNVFEDLDYFTIEG